MQFLIVLLATACLINQISCDGDHAHTHAHVATSSESVDTSPDIKVPPAAAPIPIQASGSAASAESSSGFGDTSSILSLISQNPALAATIAQNPTLAAAAASYLNRPSGGYDYPKPPGTGPPVGGFPGIPFGFGKGFNLDVDAGGGADGVYLLIFKKAVVVVGGGILILLILAFLQGSIATGGFLNNLFGGFSDAVAGAVNVDVGPLHKSAAGAASLNVNNRVGVGNRNPHDPQFNYQVQQGIDRRF